MQSWMQQLAAVCVLLMSCCIGPCTNRCRKKKLGKKNEEKIRKKETEGK
jgi:hypothetical protein